MFFGYDEDMFFKERGGILIKDLYLYLKQQLYYIFSFQHGLVHPRYIEQQRDLLSRVFFVEMAAVFYFVILLLFIDFRLAIFTGVCGLVEFLRYRFVSWIYFSQLFNILIPCIFISIFTYLVGPFFSLQVFPSCYIILAFVFFNYAQPFYSFILLLIPCSAFYIAIFLQSFVPIIVIEPSFIFILEVSVLTLCIIFTVVPLKFNFELNQKNLKKVFDINLQLEKVIKENQEKGYLLQKMGQQISFSTLSKGIAHEIRNPMSAILMRAEILEQNVADQKQVQKFLDVVKSEIFRILNIADTMLTYGDVAKPKKENIKLADLIDEVVFMIEGTLVAFGVNLEKKELDQRLVFVDYKQIVQVVLNLLLNAIDAVKSVDHPKISIELKSDDRLPGLWLNICDNGIGMDKESLDRVYDPFFTTKYENTGLGLSIVLKIIQYHTGKIRFRSDVGKGTQVAVYLGCRC